MPAINGKQYLERMDQLHPDVWMKGERISGKLSQHPVYKGAMQSKASLYDTQVHPDFYKKMTFTSPTSNERVGLSFLQPRTKEDLQARRYMIKTWAKKTAGMMGRTPDYLNTALMTFAASATILREQGDEFCQNLLNIYEDAREKDLSFTHSFINPQVNRSTNFQELSSQPIAAKITEKTADGLIVNGARMLATQGGMTDEVFILPTGKTDDYAFCFSIPTDAEGIKFICRESFYQDDSQFNYPLSSRFDEMDTMIVFHNVVVPWERVIFYHRNDLAHQLFARSSFTPQALHQVIIRQITKTEFLIGLAQKMVTVLNVTEYHHIQEKISEMIIGLETMKALLDRSELEAKEDEWGTMVPYVHSLFVASNIFPKLYPRMIEIIQLIGAGGMVAIPSEEDFASSLVSEIDHFCQGYACDAETKAKLFRLAWDLTMSSFGTRQTQYERYFFGDPERLTSTLYQGYPREEYISDVETFLEQNREEA
ncbi:4-hydroxyphenylacetate 3-monooxygenase, oxygenase component [Metabacillus litoralis]|uniref:4-hydroxyphenylacetate 3-monooxygenase, oxygenase component n=1 Tax=Metabacillus TaxID=2675233 RepID=UPI00203DC747|nr:4-hydroxyphenylacetate 3-monooxygenase, oxygenase component [Metabacillus litoralis]MCM3161140.1 4-hydroxyphenylacetate 3-monooxygenase, oxygenase component [Metabacillus litoralis]MCM3412014.1 4-hydroxyphenylacetate 3-monooxygenase, oxygenase component [Metabacillus litoralis]